MRTLKDQISLLEHLLDIARKRREAGETEWLEFKTNISESHSSVTYEGVGKYISGISNVSCLKDKECGYLVLGVEDTTWNVVGTNLHMADTNIGNQDLNYGCERIYHLYPLFTIAGNLTIKGNISGHLRDCGRTNDTCHVNFKGEATDV